MAARSWVAVAPAARGDRGSAVLDALRARGRGWRLLLARAGPGLWLGRACAHGRAGAPDGAGVGGHPARDEAATLPVLLGSLADLDPAPTR